MSRAVTNGNPAWFDCSFFVLSGCVPFLVLFLNKMSKEPFSMGGGSPLEGRSDFFCGTLRSQAQGLVRRTTHRQALPEFDQSVPHFVCWNPVNVSPKCPVCLGCWFGHWSLDVLGFRFCLDRKCSPLLTSVTEHFGKSLVSISTR